MINSKSEKDIYINRGKRYYYSSKKAINYYINATAEMVKNNEIEKNDGVDLYHLGYIDINDNDIFVTDDYKLRTICNKVSYKSAINVTEYLKQSN